MPRLFCDRITTRALGLCFALVPFSQPMAGEPLVVHDGVEVTKSDLETLVDVQVPESKHAFFWADEDAIRREIGNIFVVRQAAAEAKADGLDERERWVAEYFADRALLNEQVRKLFEKRLDEVDLEALAREEYLAHPERFATPEQVRVSHILVSFEDRTEAEARAKAERLLTQVRETPERFAEIARNESDDPSAGRNGGDLGFFGKGRMAKPFEEAAFSMNEPGEIVGPVKTRFGFHVIRLEAREKAGRQPFEQVKAQLVEKHRNKLRSIVKEEYIEHIRSLDGIESDQEAIRDLVKPLPNPKKLLDRGEAAPASK